VEVKGFASLCHRIQTSSGTDPSPIQWIARALSRGWEAVEAWSSQLTCI